MKTIAIVNRRGGVGKTVTAHSLGAGLIRRGRRVLFVDLDSQTNLTFDLGGTASRYSAMEVLTGSAEPADAIQHTPSGDLIGGSPSLAAADITLSDTIGKEYKLREALEQIGGQYDAIIIDTPPALGTLTVNALVAADGIVIPAQAEIHSLQGVGLIQEAIRPVQQYYNHGLRVLGILLTRYSQRTVISRDMRRNLEEIAAQIGTQVFPVPVRECTAIKEAQALQQDIFSYAPTSNAAQDYEALVQSIDELLTV